MSRDRERGGIALPAALAAVAVSAALAGAVAELTRVEVVIARHRRVAAGALAAADACLARVLAGVPPGWTFASTVTGPDGLPGTADDGIVAAPAGCTATAATAAGAAGRLLLTLDAAAGGGHRTLSALVGPAAVPGPAALLWLATLPGSPLPGRLTVDGADTGDPTVPPAAGVAAPAALDALDAWSAAALRPTAGTALPRFAAAPPFDELLTRVRAVTAPGAGSLTAAPPPPSVALVEGDLAVTAALQGAGLLVVDGALDVSGTLDFAGVIVARRLRVDGRLSIDGALWLADPTAPLDVTGDLTLRQHQGNTLAADTLAPLPRLPVLLAIRDT